MEVLKGFGAECHIHLEYRELNEPESKRGVKTFATTVKCGNLEVGALYTISLFHILVIVKGYGTEYDQEKDARPQWR